MEDLRKGIRRCDKNARTNALLPLSPRRDLPRFYPLFAVEDGILQTPTKSLRLPSQVQKDKVMTDHYFRKIIILR